MLVSSCQPSRLMDDVLLILVKYSWQWCGGRQVILHNLACIETLKFVLLPHPSYEYILSDLLGKQLLVGCLWLWKSSKPRHLELLFCELAGVCDLNWPHSSFRQKRHCPVFFLWRMHGKLGRRWRPNTRAQQVFSQVSKMTSLDCECASTVIPSLSMSYLWMVSAHPLFPLWRTHPMSSSLAPMTLFLSRFFSLHCFFLVLVGSSYSF